MDGNKESLTPIIFSIFAIAFSAGQAYAAPPQPGNRCAGIRKAETPQDAQKFYSHPECRDDALERAVALLPEAKQEEEIASFLKQTDPLSIRARHLLLSIYLKSAPEKALEQYEIIHQLEPEYFSELQEAEILIRLGKEQKATRILDKLVKTNPGHLDARRLRAVAHFEAKNYGESLDDLQLFLDGSPESAPYVLAASKTLYRLGKKVKARDLLTRIDLKDIGESELISLGVLAEKLGDFTLAENAFRALSPDLVSHSILLSRVLKKQGKVEDSDEVLAAAKVRFPSDDFLLAEIFQSKVEQGRIFAAARFLEQWGERFPEKPWVKSQLSELRGKFSASKVLGTVSEATHRVPASAPTANTTAKVRNPTKRFTSVRAGESLMTVSFRLYGTHQRWREIFSANRDRLGSPDSITAGMRLRVPDFSTVSAE